MKIALIGYGKMGQEIEKLAIKREHEILLIINNQEDWKNHGEFLPNADIAIEFSTPSTVVDNIYQCFNANVPVVTGTTGWLEEQAKIRKNCVEHHHSLFYSTNFSIGVNLFFDLNRHLARLMTRWEGYEISIEETHHIHKQDAPSGTAIVLANDIIRIIERKEKWVKELSENPGEVGIKSLRTEDVPGFHQVKYESEEDIIEIRHNAKSRKGFALGAIMAAEWMIGKTGYFEMKDFLESQKMSEAG